MAEGQADKETKQKLVPPSAEEILRWAEQNQARKKPKKPKWVKEAEVELPVVSKSTWGPRRAKKHGAAFQPGRSNLPSDVFGDQHEDRRNPEDIVIQEEEKEEKKTKKK